VLANVTLNPTVFVTAWTIAAVPPVKTQFGAPVNALAKFTEQDVAAAVCPLIVPE
jgi:hypothetical protein